MWFFTEGTNVLSGSGPLLQQGAREVHHPFLQHNLPVNQSLCLQNLVYSYPGQKNVHNRRVGDHIYRGMSILQCNKISEKKESQVVILFIPSFIKKTYSERATYLYLQRIISLRYVKKSMVL